MFITDPLGVAEEVAHALADPASSVIAGLGFRAGKGHRAAYVSGRAALDNARARANAEELIPYSAHADFDELLSIVEATGAREVDVIEGYAGAFARILRRRGFDARRAGE